MHCNLFLMSGGKVAELLDVIHATKVVEADQLCPATLETLGKSSVDKVVHFLFLL